MNTSALDCPFCGLPDSRVVHAGRVDAVVRDTYPVGSGHTLLTPRRHGGSFFDLNDAERAAMLAPLERARAELDQQCEPDGCTIGINDRPAAGQKVPHAHLHLIPRHRDDVEDPRGGIRGALAAKARYWG